MNDEHFPLLVQEARWLISEGLSESAEILAQLFLSSSTAATVPVAGRAMARGKDSHLLCTVEAYEIIGDALHNRKEVKRSLNYFRLARQQRKFLQSNNMSSNSNSNNNSNKGSALPSRLASDGHRSAELSLIRKEALCLRELRDHSGALSVLEAVPERQRDLRHFLLAAELFLEANLKPQAVNAYKEALSRAPLGVEIAKKLAALGVDDATLLSIVKDALREREDRQELTQVLLGHENWYFLFISAVHYLRTYQVHKSVPAMQTLLAIFPKNPLLLTMAVEAFTQNEMNEQADAYFQQLRRTDSSVVDDTDRLALLLWRRRRETELSRLASDVIASNPQRPEGYNIAALYSALRNESHHALAFVEKACLLKPTHAINYIVRGQIHLSKENHTQALIAFVQANAISPDLFSFQGMIETNTGLGKLKDAAKSARDMVAIFSKSADACFYLGKVLSKARGPEGVNASINAFMKTLKIHPRHRDAAIALATTYLENERSQEAVECLEQIMKFVSDQELRLLLAKAYSASGRNEDALEQLQLCGSLQAHQTDPAVLQEIDRIEGVFKAENCIEEEYEDEHAHLADDYSGSYQDAQYTPQYDNDSDGFNSRRRGRMFSDEESIN